MIEQSDREAAWPFRLHEDVSYKRWMAGDFDHCVAIQGFASYRRLIEAEKLHNLVEAARPIVEALQSLDEDDLMHNWADIQGNPIADKITFGHLETLRIALG